MALMFLMVRAFFSMLGVPFKYRRPRRRELRVMRDDEVERVYQMDI